jgi:hypothetical protein
MTTVLVVDASTAGRELLHVLLGLSGHHVVEADGGSQALAVARLECPEVVVAGATPDRYGRDLVRTLREDPHTATIPVVLYGGLGDEPELRSVAQTYHVERIVPRSPDPAPLLDAVAAVLAAHQPPDERGLRELLDVAPVGIVRGTTTGATTGAAGYVSAGLVRITGMPVGELLGTGWLVALSPDCRRAVADALAADATGRTQPAEPLRRLDRVDRPGHPPRWLEVHVRRTPEGFVAFILDVTAAMTSDRRTSRPAPRPLGSTAGPPPASVEEERVESLRRLASSVAHGYNNALAVILSYGEFLRDRLGEARAHGRLDQGTAHDLQLDLEAILAAGRRAAHLTGQLLSFGDRREPPTPSAVDLNAALRTEVDAVSARLPDAVTLRLELADGLSPVIIDGGQLGEILRNLADNACEAMPDGGELSIETAAGQRRSGEEYVRLTVRDTGHGMAPHVAQHALEPFFTTKRGARGGGLGLTAVFGTVRQVGGDVAIESAPGAGSRVHVLLPVAAEPADRGPDPAAGPAADARGMTETILVVDDEEPVRLLVQRILARAGYRVLIAADATEAFAQARSHPGPVHCLITDLAMPGMPGSELTRRLIAERSELATLYMSGYAEADLHHVGNADNRINLLPKPFTRVDLLTAVRATIGEHRARGR